MQIYLIKYEKDNKELKKVVLKITNELTDETHGYSGFLNELEEERSWGKNGRLEASATIYRDKEISKK